MTSLGRRLQACWLAGVLACVACRDAGPSPAALAEQAPKIRASRLVLGIPDYYGDSAGARVLGAHLSQALGVRVEVKVGEPYRQLPGWLRMNVVDVAQVPPLAYVRLQAAVPGVRPIATPIVGGSPTFLGHLYVRDDSPIQSLADLGGRRMAFVSRESSSGYLFPRDLLRRKGLEPDHLFSQVRFYRSHGSVLHAVLSGEADVGASFDATSDWAGPMARPAGLRVIAKTERIPNDCLVGREGLDPGLEIRLRDELLNLRPGTAAGDAVLRGMHVNGWVAADEARYARIRALVRKEDAVGATGQPRGGRSTLPRRGRRRRVGCAVA